MFGLTSRVAGATLVLLALQTLWGDLLVAQPVTQEAGLPTLSGLLGILALSLVAASAGQQGWTLSVTVFILYFGINRLSPLEEILEFKIGLNPHEIFRLMASKFCTALIFSPLLVLIPGCWNNDGQEESKVTIPRSASG